MEGSQLFKFHFPFNKEERWIYIFFRQLNLCSKSYKPAKGSLSSSQLFVTSLHVWLPLHFEI